MDSGIFFPGGRTPPLPIVSQSLSCPWLQEGSVSAPPIPEEGASTNVKKYCIVANRQCSSDVCPTVHCYSLQCSLVNRLGQIREGWCRIRDRIQEAKGLGSSAILIASLHSETKMIGGQRPLCIRFQGYFTPQWVG